MFLNIENWLRKNIEIQHGATMVEFQDAPWLLKKGRLKKEGLFYSISFEIISMQQPNT